MFTCVCAFELCICETPSEIVVPAKVMFSVYLISNVVKFIFEIFYHICISVSLKFQYVNIKDQKE